MNLLCKIFGHKWKVAKIICHPGGVAVVTTVCKRCLEEQKELELFHAGIHDTGGEVMIDIEKVKREGAMARLYEGTKDNLSMAKEHICEARNVFMGDFVGHLDAAEQSIRNARALHAEYMRMKEEEVAPTPIAKGRQACHNCKYENRSAHTAPCVTCFHHDSTCSSQWEAKDA